ncbi:MAG: Arginine biosynthesis bifunctional protein ArgJ [Spartobacteria bacterium]|nr:Arginine biosynthesis bifunctional protein ArgJ [Spartobacteria bacterium]
MRSLNFKKISGSICAPIGFKAAAVFCDIKKLGTGKGSEKGRKLDLALIVSDVPALVAGMFTSNQVCAAPVKLSAKHAAKGSGCAVVINSGNANACTGKQGMKDAMQMTRETARTLSARRLGKDVRSTDVADPRRKISPEDVLVCSTGRIGVPMPMRNVVRGIRQCASELVRSYGSARDLAEAIMTSDTRRKEIAVEFNLGGKPVRIGAICKGAGMIQPGMSSEGWGKRRGLHATMLAFIVTDAAISPPALRRCLSAAVTKSFNRITVDGDMSTNDSVIILANGLAKNLIIKNNTSRAFRIFEEALKYVALELAKMIVRDGEGVSRFVTLHVHGAATSHDAELGARAISNSSLVRTSWCGGDPNWGRILCALGYSGAKVDESLVNVGYSQAGNRQIVYGFRRGAPTKTTLQELAKITSAPEFDIHVDLGLGKGDFTMYASDLTEEYVAFNKGDLTNPAALGG